MCPHDAQDAICGALAPVARSWALRFDRMPPGPNDRLHFRDRARMTRAWKEQAAIRVRLYGIPRLGRIRLAAVFYRKRLGVADEDNDVARLKPIVDGIVAAGVVPTDTRAFVEWGTVGEQRGAPGVELIIEEVDDA